MQRDASRRVFRAGNLNRVLFFVIEEHTLITAAHTEADSGLGGEIVRGHIVQSAQRTSIFLSSAGQDNGQISSSIDHISGEQVNYTYDPLKRLTAAATVGPQWGQAYTYDGFGNLTAQTVTQGSGVNWTNASNPANNRMTGMTYDANGNWNRGDLSTVYDDENRLVSGQVNHPGCSGTANWVYDPSGKRVMSFDPCTDYPYLHVTFYDIFGKRVTTYTCMPAAWDPNGYGGCGAAPIESEVYFGNKLISLNNAAVVTDRLGTVRANASGERFSFLPYGEERTSTADNRVKFGTYFRDSTGTTSQDYADQRYYNFWHGRFNTADPARGSDPSNPASWNKYAYVNGDPINNLDPHGTDSCSANGFVDGGCYDPCANGFEPYVAPYNSQCGGGSGPGYWGPAAIGAAITAVAAAAETEADTLCTAANGLTPDQTLAVQTVMGENSWYLLGHTSYLPGDTRGSPTGPTITASSVFTEDLDMFSVLSNRAAAEKSTIGAVATQKGQFGGYNNRPGGGVAKYNEAINSQQRSSPCNDLTGVVDAMNAIFQSGSLLPSNYLYWKAIDQGMIGFHHYQPGDTYVANTAFEVVDTH